MRTMISRSFSRLRTSQPIPHFSSVAGWKFSTSTSDCRMSAFSSSAPSGLRRSSVADFLLRVSDSQGSESPQGVRVPKRRSASPMPGSSSLITSAPNSASCVEQNGPARKLDTSITLTPSSGLTPVFSAACASAIGLTPVSCGRDALDHREHALGLVENRIVHELPVELERRRAGGLGLREGRDDAPGARDLALARREGGVRHRHLIRMDAELPLEAQAADAFGGGAEAVRVLEVDPHGVERRLEP